MHPYRKFVSETARLAREARSCDPRSLSAAPRPALDPEAPHVLIFAPHPDDECLIGALPLRLLRQGKMRVIDVAVTQGSQKDRQGPRLEELKRACAFLGFEILTTAAGGLERINPGTRVADPAAWTAAVEVISELLRRQRPRVIFYPHAGDWNGTHVGTHFLVMDALALQDARFTCHLVETEYWAAMAAPNLMIESTVDDVGDLVAATACHVGEVQRNPYHLTLPAWMQDNVRRGGELVGGQGHAAPDFAFATLYGLHRWRNGAIETPFAGGRVLGWQDDCGALFPPL
jgi:N-acetylglucosamine malate deacetylase 1